MKTGRLEIPWIHLATEAIERAVAALEKAGFRPEKSNCPSTSPDIRVSLQLSTEDFYADFPARAVPADVHGILLRVASLEDTFKGRLLAYQDAERRASKRQKYLLDIMRLVEVHPKLKKLLPAIVARKIQE